MTRKVSVEYKAVPLPDPQRVDIQAELAALKQLLLSLNAPEQGKIERRFEDIEEELKKPDPNRDEVGEALDKAIGYAQKANGFSEAMAKLAPHVQQAAGWLGQNWYKILAAVGLSAL